MHQSASSAHSRFRQPRTVDLVTLGQRHFTKHRAITAREAGFRADFHAPPSFALALALALARPLELPPVSPMLPLSRSASRHEASPPASSLSDRRPTVPAPLPPRASTLAADLEKAGMVTLCPCLVACLRLQRRIFLDALYSSFEGALPIFSLTGPIATLPGQLN
jgi:hypothetical protein